MQADGVDGDLLNEAKNQAIDVVNSLDENERINILTSDLQSIHQRFYSKSEVIELIKEIDFSAKTTQLSDVLRLQSDLIQSLEQTGNSRLFLLSDFQKESTTLTDLQLAEIQTYYYQAKPINPENIFIDSVWFESPVHRANSPVDVHFRIQNKSKLDLTDLRIRLAINGSEPGPKRISIPAGSFAEETITFTDRSAGIKEGELSIETGQLFFDDSFYFTYTIKEDVKILLVSGKNQSSSNLEQLYNLEAYYNATSKSLDALVPEDFENKELIVIQNADKIPSGIMELLDGALKNGGTVVLIPGANADLTSWNTYLTRHELPTFGGLDTSNVELSYFNADDPIYTGVFENKPSNYRHPILFSRYQLRKTNSQRYLTLFGSSQENPFLLYSMRGNGRIVLLTAPLLPDYTNFQNHALFAATFLRIAETASFQKPLYMTIGEMDNFPLQTSVSEKNPIHLMNPAYQVDVIPLLINVANSRAISFSHLENSVTKAGFYTLSDQLKFNEVIALNYNRLESNIEAFSPEEIQLNFSEIGWNKAKAFELNTDGKVQINQLKAKEYWRILLILALVFIAFEILLLKLWKR